MDKLLEFCAALDRTGVRYRMQTVRPEAVMVTVVIPGEYLEIEFFADDGHIEIERFISQGVDDQDGDLHELIARLTA